MTDTLFNIVGASSDLRSLMIENGAEISTTGFTRISSDFFKVGNQRGQKRYGGVGIQFDISDFNAGMRALMTAIKLKDATGYEEMKTMLEWITEKARIYAPRDTEEDHQLRHPNLPHLDESIFFVVAPNGYGFITVDPRIEWAAIQHETEYYKHDNPEKPLGRWKYIEQAMHESAGMMKRVGEAALSGIYNDARKLKAVESTKVKFSNLESIHNAR